MSSIMSPAAITSPTTSTPTLSSLSTPTSTTSTAPHDPTTLVPTSTQTPTLEMANVKENIYRVDAVNPPQYSNKPEYSTSSTEVIHESITSNSKLIHPDALLPIEYTYLEVVCKNNIKYLGYLIQSDREKNEITLSNVLVNNMTIDSSPQAIPMSTTFLQTIVLNVKAVKTINVVQTVNQVRRNIEVVVAVDGDGDGNSNKSSNNSNANIDTE